MAGEDEKEESTGEVIKRGFMIKRSQNKKRFTPVNYKHRWFEISRRYLIYYDTNEEVSFIIFNYFYLYFINFFLHDNDNLCLNISV